MQFQHFINCNKLQIQKDCTLHTKTSFMVPNGTPKLYKSYMRSVEHHGIHIRDFAITLRTRPQAHIEQTGRLNIGLTYIRRNNRHLAEKIAR